MNNESLTDEQFWSEIWNLQQHKIRKLCSVYVANRQLARLFQCGLASLESAGPSRSLIEIGCADSLWLPFLAENAGMEAYGIDYSEIGCQLTRRNLAIKGVRATVICQDFLNFATSHSTAFDFAYSMGVIEHFTEPTVILKAMYRILKPGGRMLTIIPNLRGVYTPIAKVASPQILAKHRVIRPVELRRYLQAVGSNSIAAGYTGGAFKLSLVDFSPWIPAIGKRGHEILCKFINLTDIVVANALAALRIPNQQLTSPYVYAICGKSRY
jgi:2-polyprenyl-6-hydroxyphenyl methylase/3-demethylubiquinone-9 3-methyltransferase